MVQGLQLQDLVAQFDRRGLVRVREEGGGLGAVEEGALGGDEVRGKKNCFAEGGEEGVEFEGRGWGEDWESAWKGG